MLRRGSGSGAAAASQRSPASPAQAPRCRAGAGTTSSIGSWTDAAPRCRAGAGDGERREAVLLERLRAARAPRDASCPRCGSARTQRWGGYRGRRRRRCLECRRTFSDLTGTPLVYLKRLDGWAGFCACLVAGLSVRRTARYLGIHKDTAFRWRHRLLAALLADECGLLAGDVVTEETWFAHSEKGSRRLRREPRRRGVRGLAFQQPAVARVFLAVDPNRTAAGAVVGPRRPGPGDVAVVLHGRLAPGAVLTTREGPGCAVARFARSRGIPWRRRSANDRVAITLRERRWRVRPGCDWNALWSPSVDPGLAYVWRLEIALNRFRGVATRYLPHYLLWFRLVDARRPRARTLECVIVGRFP